MGKILIFMPWITIERPLDVGNYIMLPMSNLKKNRKIARNEKDQIGKILNQYRMSPLMVERSNATIIYNREYGIFSEENENDIEGIYEAMRAFAFSCICANEYYATDRYYINASCFQIIRQKFEFGNDGVSFLSKRRDGSRLDGGYKYAHLKNTAPPWIRQCRNFRTNTEVLNSIEEIRISKESKYRAIIAAINWFMLSFTDDPQFDYKIELSALLAAFEQIDHGIKGNTLESKYFPGSRIDGLPKGVADWFNEFRDVRNEYLHGTKKKKTLTDSQHLFIGTVIFCLFVKIILRKEANYKYSVDDKREEKAIVMFINMPEYHKWNDYLISLNIGDILDTIIKKGFDEES